MEQRGVLCSWNDDKGFGFIRPDAGGPDVFAHISAMPGGRRPSVGDEVLYLPGKDAQGRLRADLVRLARGGKVKKSGANAGSPSGADGQGGVRNVSGKLLMLVGLCVIPLCGAYSLFNQTGFAGALLAYPLASLVSIVQYWHDKRSARSGRWRVPENTLHIVELFGGWPGALVAQQVFRHKTRKLSFQAVVWLIILVHQVVWADWLVLDGQLFSHWLSGLIRY